jgi:hypothetical protein
MFYRNLRGTWFYSLRTVLLSRLLNSASFWPMLRMQTSLFARYAVGTPAGGEMSGLTAHFLFAENFPGNWGIFVGFGLNGG